jgi:hypothetical protein
MPGISEFTAHAATAEEAARLCAICQTGIVAGEAIGPCPACASTFHHECWTENGGCAVYGCSRMPQTVKSETPGTAPQSYWGQDEKDCPKCGKKIKVAAVRCRHCQAAFDTAAPLTRREHAEKQRVRPLLESLKKTSVTLFVCGIIPFVAPLAALLGGIWFLSNRKEIRKLPAMNRVFCYVGLIASLLCTTTIILVMVFH